MNPLRLIRALAILLLLSAPAQGQTSPELHPGDWVRVQPRVGERTSGTLVTIADDQIRLETGGAVPVEFAFSEVARLELGTGRDRVRGFTVGGAIGGMGGIVLGAAMSFLGIPGGSGPSFAVIGVPLATLPAGAVLGALLAPRRYVDVSVTDR